MTIIAHCPPVVHVSTAVRIMAPLATTGIEAPHHLGGRQRYEIDTEFRPTFEDRVEISRVSEIEWSGFCLGCSGESVVGSPEYTPSELAAFMRGHKAGFEAFETEQFELWVDQQEREAEMNRDPMERIAQVELDRVGGYAAVARSV